MKKILLFAIAFAFVLHVNSQVPLGFSYQAVIRDSEGQPISGQDVGIRLSIQNESGTEVHYTETHSETTSPQGVVILTVGQGNDPVGVFSEIPWSTGDLFLKVEVDPTGGTTYTELGIKKLNAVPFALFAADGNPGPQGEVGEPGPQGETGLQGDTGPQGDKGETGEQGIQGVTGEPGSSGVDGKTVLSGTADPATGVGSVGDFYINTSSSLLFGPKTLAGWGTGSSLVGPKGDPGVAIQWLGSLTDEPTSATLNQAYYNSTTKISYVFNGSLWKEMAHDGATGPKGPAGTGLNNQGNWAAGTYYPGDYVFAPSLADPLVTSMWIVNLEEGQTLSSTQPPRDDSANWIEFTAPEGPQGASGKTVLNGSTNPTAAVGVDGDFYINTGSNTLFGPKAGGAWPTGVLLVGPTGSAGSDGSDGADGKTVLHGEGIPASGLGVDGDFYINTLTYEIFGPKAAGSWPSSGTSLIGPLVTGSSNQTLRHDGSGWVPSNTLVNTGTSVGIGTKTPGVALDVVGDIRASGAIIGQSLEVNAPVSQEEPLFVVRNSAGLIVFAVYESGVRVYVDSDNAKSGAKGGFAIGGLTPAKDNGMEYFHVTPDSVRIYVDPNESLSPKGGFAVGSITSPTTWPVDLMRVSIDSTRIYVDNPAKSGAKGGFAIGGLTPAKGTPNELLYISHDSARIYIDTQASTGGKPSKGGFAIGGMTPAKAGYEDYLRVTRDSTRIYIDDAAKSGAKGGFAIGGLTPAKGTMGAEFFNVSTGEMGIIENEARILWYPLKNAFLAGLVNIADPLDVGENSMSIGYKTVAKGDYSQALGYEAQALGNYSTAIGRNAVADGDESYAFGNSATTQNSGSYAIGTGAKATGLRSFALGSTGVDFEGIPTNSTMATGDYSYAFGMGSIASGKGSIALGTQNSSSGEYSIAMGYNSTANRNFANAFGKECLAAGYNSFVAGDCNTASGNYAVAFGQTSTASGDYSAAIGGSCLASGYGSFAAGILNKATGQASVAFGQSSVAAGHWSGAFGVEMNVTATAHYSFGFNLGLPASYITQPNTMAIMNGSVGIGTVSPDRPLTIQGTGSNNELLSLKNNTGNTKWHLNFSNSGLNIAESGVADARLFIKEGGNIGIGSTDPGSYKLYVAGNAWSTGTWGSSDARWKKNITPIPNALQKAMQLNGVLYEWRREDFPDLNFDSGIHIGLIAQEVEKIYPELVKTNDDGYKAVAYDKLSAILLEAIKEQQQIIENQQGQIDELKQKNSEIDNLKAELETIKAMLTK